MRRLHFQLLFLVSVVHKSLCSDPAPTNEVGVGVLFLSVPRVCLHQMRCRLQLAHFVGTDPPQGGCHKTLFAEMWCRYIATTRTPHTINVAVLVNVDKLYPLAAKCSKYFLSLLFPCFATKTMKFFQCLRPPTNGEVFALLFSFPTLYLSLLFCFVFLVSCFKFWKAGITSLALFRRSNFLSDFPRLRARDAHSSFCPVVNDIQSQTRKPTKRKTNGVSYIFWLDHGFTALFWTQPSDLASLAR